MANDTIDAGKYGSKEIAAAAIEIALTKDRVSEKRLQSEYGKSAYALLRWTTEESLSPLL